MNFKKMLVLPLSITLISGTLIACGESSGDNSNNTPTSNNINSTGGSSGDKELRICVYDGGYGSEWIDTLAAKYEEKTGVRVIAELDTTILDRLDDQLSNVSDYDIYMSHDISWQNYASRGLLANLDDLYERQIEGFENTTFEDRVIDQAVEYSKTKGKNDKEEHFYKVCYTQGAGGLIYNIDMFNENGWKVPETYDDLVELCKTINNAQVSVGDGSRNTVKPFAWSGGDRQYYWDYIVFEWWAQLAGDNKIENFKKFESSEVYNPDTNYKEFIEAYEMWYNLIALNSSYSTENSYSQKLINAQSQFANGEAAMIPYAQWAKLEIQNAVDSELDFDIAMMKTPKVNSNATDYNYLVGFGDSMIIPENSPCKDLAKDFLAYMATEEACRIFVEKAKGAFLAFDYSNVDLSEIEANDTYTKSVHEKLTQTKAFHLASKNEITVWNTNIFMPWIENKYFYQTACSDPSKYLPATVGSDIYSRANAGWNVWKRNAGL